MHFSAIASSLILGLLVQSTTAAVSYGKSSAGEPLVWIEGDSECQATRITGSGNNPCEIPFKLRNGFTYFLRGCGGAGLTLFNGDGSFNANCSPSSKTLACGVKQEWRC
ncbi:hypothetical protein GRF29_69g254188 [Pseudopithomyces chartarum]|uniref:Uncharacterized protein n=1 Tax=Pseudopithomyces chartarum TaxID=1892770 RepID=A0AAN6RHJ6_9PLEO|nr:hypothetical protein GRF29_69g254188 [Pseudopithomyces chartarum]